MTETINLITQKLGENKEVLRRLAVEQENFITGLANGHLRKRELSNENLNLESQLKDLYDQQFYRSKEALEGMAMQTGSGSINNAKSYIDRGEDALTPHRDGN